MVAMEGKYFHGCFQDRCCLLISVCECKKTSRFKLPKTPRFTDSSGDAFSHSLLMFQKIRLFHRVLGHPYVGVK